MGKVTGILLALVVSAGAAEKPQMLRTWAEDRWAVVTVREVTGTIVVVSPAVGREIDFDEGNQLAVFQGVTEYIKRSNVPTLTYPVTGFQSAVFLKLADDQYGICVTFRDEAGTRCRLLHIRDIEELHRIRDYIHRMSNVQAAPNYPLVTEEKATYEVISPVYRAHERLQVKMALADGEKIKGELLPMMEDEQMLINTPLGFRRINVGAIDQIQIPPRGGKRIVTGTIQSGMKYGILGGITGLLAGLSFEGLSAKNEMVLGALLGGTVGASVGFLDGLLSIERAQTFRFGRGDADGEPKIRLLPQQLKPSRAISFILSFSIQL